MNLPVKIFLTICKLFRKIIIKISSEAFCLNFHSYFFDNGLQWDKRGIILPDASGQSGIKTAYKRSSIV